MDYWDGKIAGLLHDPLDKVFRKDHFVFAENVASKILGSSVNVDEIKGEIRAHHSGGCLLFPDKAASASNRTLTPLINPQKVLLQNPFSGVLFDLNLPSPFSYGDAVPQLTVSLPAANGREAALRVLSKLVEVYKDIWRGVNAAVVKSLLLLPEDTRIPSSPMISHLQMVSALTDATRVEPGFYMVYLDIGGVQEFISVSRKTVDFWASSYLLSLVSLSALLPLMRKFGPQQIIIPWFLRSPLVETCLFGRQVDLNDVLSSTIPNAALMVIKGTPDGNVDEKKIREMMYHGMVEFWNNVCEVLIKKLRRDYGVDGGVEAQVRRHMEFTSIFTKIRVAVLNTAPLLSGEKQGGWAGEAYEKARNEGKYNRLAELKNELAGLDLGYESYALEDFEALVKTLTVAMGSRKQYEAFSAEKVPRGKSKCSLCGIRDHLELDDKTWEKMEEKLVVDRNERLCAVCLLKRLLREILPEVIGELGGKVSVGKDRFRIPSVSDVATAWFRASVLSLILASAELNRFDEACMAAEALLKYLDEAGKLAGKKPEEDERAFPNKLIKDLHDKALHVLSKLAEGAGGDFRVKIGTLSRLADEMCFADSSVLLFDELTVRVARSKAADREALEKVKGSYEEACRALKDLCVRNNKLVALASAKLFEHVCLLLKLSGVGGNNVSSKIAEVILSPLREPCEIVKKKGDKKLSVPVSFRPQERFVLLRMDGDDVGKWISGELLPPWQILITPSDESQIVSHRNMLKEKTGDDFSDVYSRNRPTSPSTLSVLSMVITLNIPVVKSVVEAFGGFLIYTGGDDVLALLPPEVWHYVYLLLRFLYSREIMDSFRLDEDGLYVYGMGVRATASFSVVVAHHKAHLKQVIKCSHEILERSAKELARMEEGVEGRVKVKDGLSVVLMSRSTPITVCAVPNVLIKSGGKLLSIRELDKKARRKVEDKIRNLEDGAVKAWMEEFTHLIKVICGQSVHTYRDFYSNTSDLHFAGVSPGTGGVIDWETNSVSGKNVDDMVYVPLSDAVALCDLTASGIVSSRAFHDIYSFHEDTSIGEMGSENLDAAVTLLRASLKHKVKKEKKEEDVPLAEVLLRSVEKLLSERFSVGGGKSEGERRGTVLSLLEVVPLSLILSRCLENAVLSCGGW
ncbi:MAG: type III-B CRISPR-associated protein Cas10/Cmr2 [Candidatus Jordarchaeales archaeon]